MALWSRSISRGDVLIPGATVRVRPPVQRKFRFYLDAGKFAHLTISQHDVDVAIAYQVKGARKPNEIDSYEYGEESVSIVAESSHSVVVEVLIKSVNSDDAFYTITIDSIRPASLPDDIRKQAERDATAVKVSLGQRGVRPGGDILDKSRQVTGLWRRLNAPMLEAASIIQTGNVLYSQGKIMEARDAYLKALALTALHADAANAAESANNAGYMELLLGQVRASEEHFVIAQRIWTGMGSRFGRLTALNNSGLLEWQTGEFASARRQYQEALTLVSKNDPRSRGILLNNLGLILRSMGDYPQAIEKLLQSLELLPVSDTAAQAKTMINLGRAYLFSGPVTSSVDWFNRALPLARKSPDPHIVADVLSGLGQAHLEQGQLEEAESQLRQAMDIHRTAGDKRGLASALHHLGLARADRHDYRGGLMLLNQALRLRRSGELRDDAADTLFALAQVSYRAGKLNQARGFAAQALEMIESLRSGIPGEHFRISYFSAKQPFFEFYIDLLMQMDRASPGSGFDRDAFNIAEHARGRVMLEILGEGRAEIRNGAAPELLNRERTARRTLGFLSGEMSRLQEKLHTPEREAELQHRLAIAVQDYRDIETEIRDKSPAYANLIFPRPKNLPVIQRKALDDNTVLMEYSLGRDRSYLWLVTRGSIFSFQLPGESSLRPLCDQMYRLAADYRGRLRSPSQDLSYKQDADILSRMLLRPVTRHLVGKKLLIVTPGLLQKVPFAALSISGIQNPDGAPLGVTHEIVRMTSASAFLEEREEHRGRARPSASVAVFADPVFDRSDNRLAVAYRSRAATSSRPLARLPITGVEAEEILRLFPSGRSLNALGFDASRENLQRPDIKTFRYIHFGTHAVIDQIPELSGIALSNVTRQGKIVDGFVRLSDIYNLPPLSCDLVVLATCDSGSGPEVRGEGLIGLSRGFLYAGARSVLINLWTLEDSPWTAEVMKSLYAGLSNGELHPAGALRAARDLLWRRGGRWKDDYFLAGLEVYGEDN
jgi:CHAT domain-containing protein